MRARSQRWVALVGLLVALATSPPGEGWGNGCASCNPGFPYYGVHDALADAALAWYQAGAPARTAWLDRWFRDKGGDWGASFTAGLQGPTARDNWLAYTDDPDSAFQDWPNHLYLVHPRPGHDEREAPGEIARLHGLAVENLTAAKRATSDATRIDKEHRAAYHLGLVAHYLGDLSQFGHTDHTARDHRHPKDDPLGRTYHGYYESVAWGSQPLGALVDALMADPGPLDPVTDPAAEAVALAEWVNARDGGAVAYRDADGATVTVGSSYAWALDRYVAQYDAKVYHQGMRGMDAQLWGHTVDNTRAAVHLLARLLADAEERAAAAANEPPVAVIAPVEDAECGDGRGTVTLDGTASDDPDGDALTFAWSAPGASLDDAAVARTGGSFPFGATPATLRVDDGRAQDEATQQVRVVDTLPPASDVAFEGTEGQAGWWRSTVRAAFTATDACGGTRVLVSLDGSLAVEAAALDVAGDGAHRVRHHAVDDAGLAGEEREAEVRIDAAPPRTEAALAGTLGDAGWWRSSVHTDLSARDATSGVARTWVALDGGPAADATRAEVAGDGVHGLRFASEDIAGNAEPGVTMELRIDATPPTTTPEVRGTPGTAGWWRSDVEVSLDAQDATSGVAETRGAVDDEPLRAADALAVSGDGVHVVHSAARDVAGNAELQQALEVRIDATPPVTRATLSGTPGDAGWWRSQVQVRLDASDATSGVAQVWVGVDGGPLQASTATQLDGDGLHEVRFHAVDAAGNAEPEQVVEVRIDATPPEVVLREPTRGAAHVHGARLALHEPLPRTLVAGDQPVRADARDAASGVAWVELRVDGMALARDAAAPYEALWAAGSEAAGDHVVAALARDVAGNEASAALPVTTVPTTLAGLTRTVEPLLP